MYLAGGEEDRIVLYQRDSFINTFGREGDERREREDCLQSVE